jgi:hypothetical protein
MSAKNLVNTEAFILFYIVMNTSHYIFLLNL